MSGGRRQLSSMTEASSWLKEMKNAEPVTVPRLQGMLATGQPLLPLLLSLDSLSRALRLSCPHPCGQMKPTPGTNPSGSHLTPLRLLASSGESCDHLGMHDRLPGDALRGDLVPSSFLACQVGPSPWSGGRGEGLQRDRASLLPSADLGPQFPRRGYVTPEEN